MNARRTKRKWPKPAVAALLLGGLVCVGIAALQLRPKSPSAPPTGGTSKAASQQKAEPQRPLAGASFYVDPNSNAAVQASQWRTTRAGDAVLMSKLAAQPTAKWLTASASLDSSLVQYLQDAHTSGTVPALVVYNTPARDCGLYSAGGAQDLATYQKFIDSLATMIGDKKVVLIVEPDALAAIENNNAAGKPCLTSKQQTERYQALRYATEQLGKLPGSAVYLDAGNSAWVSDPAKLVERLQKAGSLASDGFSLNISNFRTIDETVSYGQKISAGLNGAHFVIDTSRNGMGAYSNPKYPNYNWCNPPGRSLGHYPTTQTGQTLVDAYLYIKSPGESDGYDPDPNKCHSGPKAGEWWPDYALELIKRWPAALQPPTTR